MSEATGFTGSTRPYGSLSRSSVSRSSLPSRRRHSPQRTSSDVGNRPETDDGAPKERATPEPAADRRKSTMRAASGQQRVVRTLPPWVHSPDDDDDDLLASPTDRLLPKPPNPVLPAMHNHMPTPKANAVPGRQYDHERERAPVAASQPVHESGRRWKGFAESSDPHHRAPSWGESVTVNNDWLQENLPDLEGPWCPEMEMEMEEKEKGYWLFTPSKRKQRLMNIQRVLMRNPIIPLIVRLTVLTFSTLALGLAVSIFQLASSTGCDIGSSTWLAIVLDAVAIVYTIFITYDEYSSKPLGLRSHRAKMRLIFLDLFFIVFDSANISLAFAALTDRQWACRDGYADEERSQRCALDGKICARQKALTAVLLVALVAWLLTFSISTLRVLERVVDR